MTDDFEIIFFSASKYTTWQNNDQNDQRVSFRFVQRLNSEHRETVLSCLSSRAR